VGNRALAIVVLAAGVLTIPSVASAASGPVTVTLRVEGATQTLFEGPVTTYAHNVKSASDTTSRECDGLNDGANATPGANSMTALNDALYTVDTSWDGTWNSSVDDYFVTRIGPDSQTSTEFWGDLINDQFAPDGDCATEVSPGDQVLWAYNAFNMEYELELTAPTTTVAPNQSLTVQVTDGFTGNDLSGAQVAPVITDPTTDYETVDTNDPSTVTTNASGDATLSWSTSGWKRIKAVETGSIRSNRLDICVTPCGTPPADTEVRSPGPTTTDNVPTTYQPHAVTVTLTATDPFSSVADTYYSVGVDPADPTTTSSIYNPGDKPVLTNGEEIKYFSVNAGGVAEPVQTSTVAKVDTTPPTTVDNVPAGFTRSNPFGATLTANDNGGAGVAATYYTVGLDPAAPTTSSAVYNPADKPVLTNGEEIKYFSVDNVGNTESVETSHVLKVDTTPPTIAATRPVAGARYTLGAAVTAAYTCADSGGPGIASCSGSTPAGQSIPSNTLGSHNITVDAVDTLGLKSSQTITYTVIPPILTLTAAKHIELAGLKGRIPVRCKLNAGRLKHCTVVVSVGRTTLATGTAAGATVDARLTASGRRLLVATLHDVNAVIEAVAAPIAGTVKAETSATVVIHTQTYTTSAGAFTPGSSSLTSAGRRSVERLARRIGQAAAIRCTGYTANLGGGITTFALALGKARASAICKQLKADGVHARYSIATKATSDPIASNRTAAGQAKNRRVLITISHAR
jgi:outer membrane protein OmpA-like peptidoglycan-associated protein